MQRAKKAGAIFPSIYTNLPLFSELDCVQTSTGEEKQKKTFVGTGNPRLVRAIGKPATGDLFE